jgi:hypothetical protein
LFFRRKDLHADLRRCGRISPGGKGDPDPGRPAPLVFVANKPIRREPSPLISSLLVPEGPDIADDRIVESAEPGDLVITTDIPLADRVVSKGAFALNPRGKLYTEENIKDRLAVRDLLSELRDGGLMTGGPPAFGKKDCQAFADQLDRFLIRRLKG